MYVVSLGLVVGGCAQPAGVEDADSVLPESLAELQLFEGELARLNPARDVTRYAINSASFADFADSRFDMKLPRGSAATYRPDEPFEFPVGTVLAQTISYADGGPAGGRRIVETRVLLRRSDKWIGLPYVWDEQQTEARLEILGARIPIRRRMTDGALREQTHVVPNFNDCKRCHRIGDVVTPIATTARQLNCPSSTGPRGDRQLVQWWRDGRLLSLPPEKEIPRLARWNDPATGTVEERARAWLEANCAHCHNPQGTARNSGLQLAAAVREPNLFGVLKTPVAAGRGSGDLQFDIVPGQPDKSILLYRVRSTAPGVVMPEFGRAQVDEQGVALLSEWIGSMSPADSSPSKPGTVGFVENLTPDELSTWGREALLHGDARRGEAVFQRESLNCTKCHAVRGRGASVGPDLATLGAQITTEHIVESILLPNKVVKEGFRAVTLQTDSGLVITGIQVREDGHEVVLRDPVRGETRIAKAEITERVEGGSLMPANVASILRREEFFDLVRYLVDLNKPSVRSAEASASSP